MNRIVIRDRPTSTEVRRDKKKIKKDQENLEVAGTNRSFGTLFTSNLIVIILRLKKVTFSAHYCHFLWYCKFYFASFTYFCFFFFLIYYLQRLIFLFNSFAVSYFTEQCCFEMTNDTFDIYILLGRMQIASFFCSQNMSLILPQRSLGTVVASPSIFFNSLHTSSNTDFSKLNILVPLLSVHTVAS